MLEGIQVMAQYRERVWGGQALREGAGEGDGDPVGEAWIVHKENKVAQGRDKGCTLDELSAKYGAEFLGRRVVAQTGTRFPLLIKLLDCQAWLSLQVHPNDEQAERLEGPGNFGKTEAWHFLEAAEDAQIIAGVREGVAQRQLAQAIRDGSVIELARYQSVAQGGSILMPAGSVHALGPGLLVYEAQQSSDITYRIFDWNRPEAEGRALHIEQSIAVSDPSLRGVYREPTPLAEGETQQLVDCPYFILDLVGAQREAVERSTQGETFHAVTVIEGEMEIEGPGWSRVVGLRQTIIVPACCGAYRLCPRGGFRALVASVG